MQIQDFSHHLEGIEQDIQRQLSKDLPKKLGNIAVRMFEDNFQSEGFFGRKWQEVQRRIPGTKSYNYLAKKNPADTKRKILSGHPPGNLGQSIKYTPHDGYVVVHSDLKYAEAHNEGTNNAGRAHNTRIPKRQFMGEDPKLTAAIEKKITEEISKALNK